MASGRPWWEMAMKEQWLIAISVAGLSISPKEEPQMTNVANSPV